MEKVVESEQVNKVKIEESGVTKSTLTADPVVYQLVRVDGDGRLVPATDDEVMEVEELLEDDKCEIQVIPETEQQVGSLSDASEKSRLNGPEEDAAEESNPPHNTTVVLEKLNAESKEIVPSSVMSLNISAIDHSKVEKHINVPGGVIKSVSTKPDFSKLKGKICLDSLSVRELHETFKATFGRETSVKDKQWLKRRISMGLTNSCDVSTTTFIIDDKKVVNICKEEETCEKIIDGSSHEDPVIEDSKVEEECNEDLSVEERAAKRVRKPTRRYIEEVSEGESREEKSNSSIKYSGESRVRQIVTRPDSLGGSGVQVPYVSRARRSRPRKNYMSLMKLQPSGMGIASRAVKKSFGPTMKRRAVHERGKKARLAPLWVQQPVINEAEKDEVEKDADSCGGNNTDENTRTTRGGMRRKHHRAWSVSEVVKLVEGVAKYGAGKWSEIKRLSFSSYSHRTSVDLKDKWRNLLRASFSQLSAEKPSSRKKTSIPVPASILARVKELAERQSQVPPDLSLKNKLAVHETRPGYL